MSIESFIWEEKYRPRVIDDCILPARIKDVLNGIVSNENFPNLILTGTPGIGKTTVARAIVEQLDLDYIMINGSMDGGIDTLRNEIKNFASTVSFKDKRKIVILDEADYLNHNSTQPALRNFMDEHKNNCGFILTCNMFNKIIEPLHGRCHVIEFKFKNKEIPDVAMEFYKKCRYILDNENVKYDKNALTSIIQKDFPDFRKILNKLQGLSITGDITLDSLLESDLDVTSLVSFLKTKNFTEIRNYTGKLYSNLGINVYNSLYEMLLPQCMKDSIPDAILIIGKYQYQSAFVASQEINLAACLTELMTIEYK